MCNFRVTEDMKMFSNLVTWVSVTVNTLICGGSIVLISSILLSVY
jgi:hypothetical protein